MWEVMTKTSAERLRRATPAAFIIPARDIWTCWDNGQASVNLLHNHTCLRSCMCMHAYVHTHKTEGRTVGVHPFPPIHPPPRHYEGVHPLKGFFP